MSFEEEHGFRDKKESAGEKYVKKNLEMRKERDEMIKKHYSSKGKALNKKKK